MAHNIKGKRVFLGYYLEPAVLLYSSGHISRFVIDFCSYRIFCKIRPYLPGYLHDRGALNPRYSLDELTRLGRLPAQVEYDGSGPGFSAAIRAGIPPL